MEFIDAHNESVQGRILGQWYKEQVGEDYSNTPYLAIGIIKKNNIVGVLFFDNHVPGITINMHAHAPGCMNKKVLKYVFNFVFKQLNCEVLRATIPETHELNEILTRLDFWAEAKLSPYFKDGPAIVYKLHKKDVSSWIDIDALSTKSAKSTTGLHNDSAANAI